MLELFAHTGENHKRKAETESRGEGEEHRFAEPGTLLAVYFGRAENRAVRRDKRKKDSERRMQRRQKALHRDIDELNERGDHENKRERMDIIEAVGLQKPMIETPRDGRGDGHNEDDRA